MLPNQKNGDRGIGQLFKWSLTAIVKAFKIIITKCEAKKLKEFLNYLMQKFFF
jgi:hypothetical protein